MAGGPSGVNSPTRKRPRTQNSTTKGKRPPLGNRHSNGRLSQIRVEMDSVADIREANMPTLTDLIGGGRSKAEQFLGEEAPNNIWASFGNTLDNMGSLSNLPTVIGNDDASKVVYDADSRAFSEQLERDENVSERKFDQIPMDLTLKKKVDVVSNSTMRWALRRGQGDEYSALAKLTNGKSSTANDERQDHVLRNDRNRLEDDSNVLQAQSDVDEDVLNWKKCLYKALLHFRCPSESLPKVISSRWQVLTSNYGRASWQEHALHDEKKFAVHRLINWQSAFQSLYFGYRHGHIPDFYVLLQTTTVLFNSGRPWAGSKKRRRSTAMDSSGNDNQSSCFRASVAKASTGLRALMSEHEVPFTIVERPSSFEDPGVVVEGDFAVHALFNFLLSRGPSISNADDVPMLVCDKPFRGSTIYSAEVLNARQMLIPGKLGEQPEHRYTMQLSGLFTPGQISDMCNSLARIQCGEFAARFDTDEAGNMLNSFGHGGDSSDGDEAEEDKLRLRGPLFLSRVQMDSAQTGFSVTTREAK